MNIKSLREIQQDLFSIAENLDAELTKLQAEQDTSTPDWLNEIDSNGGSGRLCWVSDADKNERRGARFIVSAYEEQDYTLTYLDTTGENWRYAQPVTKTDTEIQ